MICGITHLIFKPDKYLILPPDGATNAREINYHVEHSLDGYRQNFSRIGLLDFRKWKRAKSVEDPTRF